MAQFPDVGRFDAVFETELRTDCTAIRSEILLLPLRNDRNEHFQALGIQAFPADASWYGNKQSVTNRLLARRPIVEAVDLRPADVFCGRRSSERHRSISTRTSARNSPQGWASQYHRRRRELKIFALIPPKLLVRIHIIIRNQASNQKYLL